MKKFYCYYNLVYNLIYNFFTPSEPEIEEEYVDKVVRLLRRDFTTNEQNTILLSIAQKLSELRELDMRKMEKEYKDLQESTYTLRTKLII